VELRVRGDRADQKSDRPSDSIDPTVEHIRYV